MIDQAVIARDPIVSQNVTARLSSLTNRSAISTTEIRINNVISGAAAVNSPNIILTLTYRPASLL